MNAIEQREIYAKSNFEVMTELGARFRAYRIALGLSRRGGRTVRNDQYDGQPVRVREGRQHPTVDFWDCFVP